MSTLLLAHSRCIGNQSMKAWDIFATNAIMLLQHILENQLNKHKEEDHEGIRYPCDKCEFAATLPDVLKRHKREVHEGV